MERRPEDQPLGRDDRDRGHDPAPPSFDRPVGAGIDALFQQVAPPDGALGQAQQLADILLHREVARRPDVAAPLGEQQVDFRRPALDSLETT